MNDDALSQPAVSTTEHGSNDELLSVSPPVSELLGSSGQCVVWIRQSSVSSTMVVELGSVLGSGGTHPAVSTRQSVSNVSPDVACVSPTLVGFVQLVPDWHASSVVPVVGAVEDDVSVVSSLPADVIASLGPHPTTTNKAKDKVNVRIPAL